MSIRYPVDCCGRSARSSSTKSTSINFLPDIRRGHIAHLYRTTCLDTPLSSPRPQDTTQGSSIHSPHHPPTPPPSHLFSLPFFVCVMTVRWLVPVRGVHEISPMKAANGGLLHELFDYSHPFLLGGKSRQPAKASSLAPSSLPPRSPDSEPPATGSTVGGIAPDARVPQTIDRGRSAEVHGEGGRWLGRLLPRCLLMHGMADATVPFAQTAAVAAALKALGVPTIVRFIPGGGLGLPRLPAPCQRCALPLCALREVDAAHARAAVIHACV